jgi:hypothetical protein
MGVAEFQTWRLKMAGDKERATTPPQHDIPTPQLPGADYSYTVELVGAIQNQLGMLTEAVNSLKEQSKETSKKLDDVRMDVHAAKAAGKALLWIVGIVGTLLGLFLAAYFRQLLSGSAK